MARKSLLMAAVACKAYWFCSVLFFQHKDACLESSPFLNAMPQKAPLSFLLPSSELKESHTQLQKSSVVHF